MDLFYRHNRGELIPWWRSDRGAFFYRGTGWIVACPAAAFELRHATMLEF